MATCVADPQAKAPYEALGCRVLTLPKQNGMVDLDALWGALGREGVDSILLEGGSALHWSALEQGLVNKVQAYIAPKLLGGGAAKSPIGGQGFPHPDLAVRLKHPVVTRLGDDFLIESEVSA